MKLFSPANTIRENSIFALGQHNMIAPVLKGEIKRETLSDNRPSEFKHSFNQRRQKFKDRRVRQA